jgi:hypothetical protein
MGWHCLWMKYASDGVARKVSLCVEVKPGFLPVEQATTISYRVSRQGRGVNGDEANRVAAPKPLCDPVSSVFKVFWVK